MNPSQQMRWGVVRTPQIDSNSHRELPLAGSATNHNQGLGLGGGESAGCLAVLTRGHGRVAWAKATPNDLGGSLVAEAALP